MEEFNMDEFNNLSSDDQWWLLVLLLFESSKKVDIQIQQFENDLIYKNRFSSKHAVVEEIHKHKEEAQTAHKGTGNISNKHNEIYAKYPSLTNVLFARMLC